MYPLTSDSLRRDSSATTSFRQIFPCPPYLLTFGCSDGCREVYFRHSGIVDLVFLYGGEFVALIRQPLLCIPRTNAEDIPETNRLGFSPSDIPVCRLLLNSDAPCDVNCN